MDHRQSLEKLAQLFSCEDLTLFLRAPSGKFKPEKADYSHYLDKANFVKDLQKLEWIEFDDSRRLIVLLSKATQRRFANISPGSTEFRKELNEVRINLGDDYLEIIKKRLGTLKSEVIIAIENKV